MKKISLFLAVICFCLVANAQKNKAKLLTKNDSIAYAISNNLGQELLKNMETDSVKFNTEVLVQGFRDAISKSKKPLLNDVIELRVLTDFRKEMLKKQSNNINNANNPSVFNKEAGKKFLAANKKQSGVVETESGLQYKVLKQGTGRVPSINDMVTVNYEGRFLNGKVFDSSYDRNKPETMSVSELIRGWMEAIQLMKEGSIYELYIPSELAYGDIGNKQIPGGTTLIFKVELIKVN